MANTTWFDRFFEEKEIGISTYSVKDSEGVTHFVDSEFVIELIKAAPQHEKKQIKDILVKIDFENGNVHHFLKFLGEQFISTQERQKEQV